MCYFLIFERGLIMTRGTVILKKGKTYLMARYSNSDSYPYGKIGEMFIRAFRAESDEQTIDIIKQYILFDNGESEISGNCLEGLIKYGEGFYNSKKSSPNSYFYDYYYVFDTNTMTLKIYYFGTLEYTFNKQDADYLEVVVKHYTDINFALGFDIKKKTCLGGRCCSSKAFMKLKREGKSAEEISDIVLSLKEHIHYKIDCGKWQDPWGNHAYQRDITFYPSYKRMTFIFEEDNFSCKWNIYVQLPWKRMRLLSDSASETAVYKRLIVFLDRHWQDLQKAIPLFEMYDSIDDKQTLTHKEYYERAQKILDKFIEKN